MAQNRAIWVAQQGDLDGTRRHKASDALDTSYERPRFALRGVSQDGGYQPYNPSEVRV
jgi:hypothetical protein